MRSGGARILLLLASACATPSARPDADAEPPNDAAPSMADADADVAIPDAPPGRDPFANGPPLGARRHDDGAIEVRVRSEHATRIEVAFFASAFGESERLRVPMELSEGVWRVHVEASELERAGVDDTIYYGLRVFGPNWPFDPAWTPGSEIGFVIDIDEDGNRMNPNKLVLDPYALETSHDPLNARNPTYDVFRSDEMHRAIDSAPFAPKGIVIDVPERAAVGPRGALRDHVVYETHLRGLTQADDTLPDRGTYAAARGEARRLRELGITAIELLPLHETPNEHNDLVESAEGDNYWGYSTISFFAPDRRYASDRSPGGPTRELRAMIEAFHAEGLEVWVDVVYNHTAEGGGGYLSFRGIDDASYYEHQDDARRYVSSNGVGPNFATARPMVGDLVIDSLRYWHEQLGVDGFRFDLAPVVGNACERGCYRYDPDGLLTRIADELGRPEDGGTGAILVAEPWGVVSGSYQLGFLPAGWAEWNDKFRDMVRRDLNRLGRDTVTLREIARRVTGSSDLFGDRTPAASINYVTAHDGFTLHDLFSYDARSNDQPYPFGPSNGGSADEPSSSHGGDAAVQRRCARTAMALIAVSHGVPMILGGDELLRTQRGNNNAYNLDTPASWLPPDSAMQERAFVAMTAALLQLRSGHAALRPRRHVAASVDADGDGVHAIAYYDDDANPATSAYLDASDRHFLSWVLDGDELGDDDAAIWVAYNGWSGAVHAVPPPLPEGMEWRLAVDTSERAASYGYVRSPGDEMLVSEWPYPMDGRSLTVFIAKGGR